MPTWDKRLKHFQASGKDHCCSKEKAHPDLVCQCKYSAGQKENRGVFHNMRHASNGAKRGGTSVSTTMIVNKVQADARRRTMLIEISIRPLPFPPLSSSFTGAVVYLFEQSAIFAFSGISGRPEANFRSLSTISRTSSRKSIRCCQPSLVRALAGLPNRISTSVGRK